jgi:chemosensory pili system protein ChpA (sensor histidine kinase/response regulator)
MQSFTIDDVRETMPREVTGFLHQIAQRAEEFLASVAWKAEPTGCLRSIRHHGHAISGSSSLVSATALASCADLVESLAERAQTELLEAEQRLARARRAIALLPAGVEQMQNALTLELEHRGEEAEWNVAEWLGEAQATLDALKLEPAPALAPSLHPRSEDESPSDAAPLAARICVVEAEPSSIEFLDEEVVVPEPAGASGVERLPPLEFSFEDFEPHAEKAAVPAENDPAAASVAADDADDGFDFGDEERVTNARRDVLAELLPIFRDEAREAVVALQGYINALGTEPSVTDSAAPLERIYHTLKGAAATVGLGEVSQRAEALQRRAESLLVLTEPLDAPALSALVDETNELFALAGLENLRVGLPALPPPSVTRAGAPPPEDVRREFLREAKEIHEQASALVAELSAPNSDELGRSLLDRLAALFHRLKGSAKLVSEASVAEVADSLERSSAAERAPTTAALSLGLARIASKLGLLGAPQPVAPAEDTAILEATRASFELEAKELVASAVRLTRELGSASTRDSAGDRTEVELSRVLHHLGGSARIVGDGAVADAAGAMERLLKQSEGSPHAALALVGERLAALRARFGVDSQASLAMTRRSPETRREKVDFGAVAELWPTFTLECAELLESIEKNCLALEDSSRPKDQIRILLRAVHTLKGVVNTIGLAPTGEALHRVEDLLEALLEAKELPPSKPLASFLIEVQAEVRKNLKEAPAGYVETRPQRLEQRVRALLSRDRDASAGVGSAGRAEATNDGPSARNTSEISVLEGSERRVIRVATERLDVLMNLAGELVVSRSRLNSRVERLRTLEGELARGSRRLLDSVDSFREEHEFANLDGRRPLLPVGRSAQQGARADDVLVASQAWGGFSELELDRYEAIHVLSRSLSEMTSDFSELHAQLSRGLVALSDDADAVGGIVSSIQSEITRARMVPLDALFMRLRLPLRDAAARENKDIRVVVQGEGLPVDKTIADALFQPMLHLVRNAVAHGVETPERRVELGKERAGTIELSARQEAGQIVIDVRDDGAGLDLAALRARGVEMGLLPVDVAPDDPSIAELVFVQGLSTKREVSELAGRGVGCDVVKRAVERLNGSIRVESRTGRGTAFVVRLPLTLAITRALIVRNAEQAYAIPLHFAERIIDAHEQDLVTTGTLRRIKLDGAFLPLRTLGDFFGAGADAAPAGPVLVLRVGDARLALQVDAVAAQEEIVVKSLGTLLAGHPAFAGITIRGTGELVPILDVPSLVEAKGSSAGRRPAAALESAEASKRPAVVAAVAPPREAAGKLRVLFVDDSVSVRKVAELELRKLGVEVVTAVDGADAMSKLREHRVDLLLTDLEMPRMHGYELIRELRFLPAYKELPIVVVTSRSSQKHQEQARQLGANAYVTKPFTAQVLESVIEQWGRRKSADAQPGAGATETLR